ncbi:hypothetical protein FNU79_01240 [Deinococcus detaillensis]|uniref:Ig-like domain-containing protein n=1 Tax=Deinococcus detaillensis TaxID=2592048 RepID=A0A553V618_9DEIO|nr:hypothetical protein [Deinococcus detaillensis]TSA87899.1 hypothetical protein FNU79_01240 [Deinococcus detaillensis]
MNVRYLLVALLSGLLLNSCAPKADTTTDADADTALTISPPDPPRSSPLSQQPADLIREECLNNLKSKLESSPAANYDENAMPKLSGESWNWESSVTDFVSNVPTDKSFSCTVVGNSLQDAAITTTLK